MAADVRPAQPADLPAIVALYNRHVTESPATFEVDPVDPRDRADWMAAHLAGGRYRLVVADDGDAIAGWAATSPFRPRAGYATTGEASVYCRPDACGRGVGTRLSAALFDAIATEEIERIVAGITLPNPASVALHARFGFRPVGTFSRVGRKFGRYWDVAWFERALRLGPSEPSRSASVRPASAVASKHL